VLNGLNVDGEEPSCTVFIEALRGSTLREGKYFVRLLVRDDNDGSLDIDLGRTDGQVLREGGRNYAKSLDDFFTFPQSARALIFEVYLIHGPVDPRDELGKLYQAQKVDTHFFPFLGPCSGTPTSSSTDAEVQEEQRSRSIEEDSEIQALSGSQALVTLTVKIARGLDAIVPCRTWTHRHVSTTETTVTNHRVEQSRNGNGRVHGNTVQHPPSPSSSRSPGLDREVNQSPYELNLNLQAGQDTLSVRRLHWFKMGIHEYNELVTREKDTNQRCILTFGIYPKHIDQGLQNLQDMALSEGTIRSPDAGVGSNQKKINNAFTNQLRNRQRREFMVLLAREYDHIWSTSRSNSYRLSYFKGKGEG